MKIKSRAKKLCDALARAASDADERVSDGVVSEITHGELLALEAAVDGARTVAALSNRLATTIPTTTDVLRRLEHKLLIKRTPITGRVSAAPLVDPTTAGRKTVERMRKFDARAEAELRRMLPLLDLEGLRVALDHDAPSASPPAAEEDPREPGLALLKAPKNTKSKEAP